MRTTALLFITLLTAAGSHAAVSVQSWGKLQNGQSVDLYTLRNAKGAEVTITNYGARIVAINVPDKAGKFDDVVLGFDNLAGYESNPIPSSAPPSAAMRIASPAPDSRSTATHTRSSKTTARTPCMAAPPVSTKKCGPPPRVTIATCS